MLCEKLNYFSSLEIANTLMGVPKEITNSPSHNLIFLKEVENFPIETKYLQTVFIQKPGLIKKIGEGIQCKSQ